MTPNDNARCTGYFLPVTHALGRYLHGECFGCERRAMDNTGARTSWVKVTEINGKCEHRKESK